MAKRKTVDQNAVQWNLEVCFADFPPSVTYLQVGIARDGEFTGCALADCGGGSRYFRWFVENVQVFLRDSTYDSPWHSATIRRMVNAVGSLRKGKCRQCP